MKFYKTKSLKIRVYLVKKCFIKILLDKSVAHDIITLDKTVRGARKR